jgi:hypothetical protein
MTRTTSPSTASRFQRFLGGLRVAEVDRAREELAAAVEAAGGEQFLGAQDAEFFVEVLAELVLAAVAAREREVGDAIAAAERQVGDQLGVLVVGMRGHVQDGARGAEAAQLLLDFSGGGHRRGRDGGGRVETEEGERQSKASFHNVGPPLVGVPFLECKQARRRAPALHGKKSGLSSTRITSGP